MVAIWVSYSTPVLRLMGMIKHLLFNWTCAVSSDCIVCCRFGGSPSINDGTPLAKRTISNAKEANTQISFGGCWCQSIDCSSVGNTSFMVMRLDLPGIAKFDCASCIGFVRRQFGLSVVQVLVVHFPITCIHFLYMIKNYYQNKCHVVSCCVVQTLPQIGILQFVQHVQRKTDLLLLCSATVDKRCFITTQLMSVFFCTDRLGVYKPRILSYFT